MIRYAIKKQNGKTLFSCSDCCFNGLVCQLDSANKISYSLRQPYQLPECFEFNYIDSVYASVLEAMLKMKLDFHEATLGWATIVNRIINRATRWGYLTNVKLHNLNKYG
jgi:hypothetical protein